jgi:type VI secretion system protein ImpL
LLLAARGRCVHGIDHTTGQRRQETPGQQAQVRLINQGANVAPLIQTKIGNSRGSLNGRTPTSVDLSFRTGDGVMRYRLNAEKAFNPITQQPFKSFRLPRGLLQQPPKVAQVEQAHGQPL